MSGSGKLMMFQSCFPVLQRVSGGHFGTNGKEVRKRGRPTKRRVLLIKRKKGKRKR